MRRQQFNLVIAARPAAVYTALLDPTLIERWRVPQGMRSTVHHFEGRTGGTFRVSLTYDAPDAQGKSGAHTDTYAGRFLELVPDRRVVEVMAFETDDPQMQGEMLITTELSPHARGCLLSATHEGLPPGVTFEDNETGWREALARLASLVSEPEAVS